MTSRRLAALVALLLFTSIGYVMSYTLEQIDPTSGLERNEAFLGEIRITVVPVAFRDVPSTMPIGNISRMVFTALNSYFQNQSYGKAWLTGEVTDWIDVPLDVSDYDKGSFLHDPDGEARRASNLFKRHALEQMHWSEANYTNHIVLLYSGSQSIHPHHSKWSIDVDGESRVCELSVVPEIGGFATLAHEVAHGLNNLHDLYDKYDIHIGSLVGNWALVAFHGHYSFVCDMCGHSKMWLGWITESETVDVKSNDSFDLIAVDEVGAGIRILRIQLDANRQYLIESRRTRGLYSGVLVFLVDATRPVGGHGRVELVRSFAGSGRNDIYRATFKSGESFIDPKNGLTMKVVGEWEKGHTVEMAFGDSQTLFGNQIELDLEDFEDCTTAVHPNGTTYFGLTNLVGNERGIGLYSLGTSLRFVTRTPEGMQCSDGSIAFSKSGEVMLLFGFTNGTKRHVYGQVGDDVFLVSGEDNASHPTAAVTYNNLFIAYENETEEGTEIVVLSSSARRWSSRMHFSESGDILIIENVNGTPHNPTLMKSNNSVILSYIRSSVDLHQLEMQDISGFESPPVIFNEGIVTSSYQVNRMGEFDILISHSYGDPETPSFDVWCLDPYHLTYELVASREGLLVDTTSILGVWVCYSNDGSLFVERVWNSYKETADFYAMTLGAKIPLALTTSCANGSTCLVLLHQYDSKFTVSLQIVTTTFIQRAPDTLVKYLPLGEMFVLGMVLALAIELRLDEKVKARFRR